MCYDLRMVFRVEITETLSRTVEADCTTAREAEELVRKQWKRGEIVLDADDFADVAFEERRQITPRKSTA